MKAKLSIIIPVFNEEKTILEILKKIKESLSGENNYEVIVIDDGSRDNTLKLLQNNKSLYNKLIINEINKGKGFAVIKGIEASEGKYIAFQDADLEYDPIEFNNILKIFNEMDADIVFGSRINYKNYTRSHNFLNLIANKSLTLYFNILFNCTFTDIYSCYLSFRRDLINTEKLKCYDFGQQAELLCQIIKKSKKNYEIPINYNGRSKEDGKKIRWYHFFSVIYQITKARLVR
tara:strand:+ start:589 stop:1287 length:699 start_codon:yes stop_codon:yes gene_type:complete